MRDLELEVLVLGHRLPTRLPLEPGLPAFNGDRREDDASKFTGQMADLDHAQRRGMHPEDRRRDPRTPTETVATMKILNPISPARVEIQVLDISDHGLGLRVPIFLSPGTAIQVRLKDSVTLAEVRYCRPTGAEFDVGVWIQDVFPWKQAGTLPSGSAES